MLELGWGCSVGPLKSLKWVVRVLWSGGLRAQVWGSKRHRGLGSREPLFFEAVPILTLES